MTYHGQQFRVRVDLTRAQALATPHYPEDLVRRAKSKMEAITAEGKIAFFSLHEARLAELWEKLRNADGEDPSLSISFTLAAGSPALPGLTIEKSTNEKIALLISVAPDAKIKTWTREWLRATILRKTKDLEITDTLSMAQVQACITRILSGEPVKAYSIPYLKAFPTTDMSGKIYGILANKARGEIAVMINDLKALQIQKNIDSLNQVILQTVEKMKQLTGGQYRYHRQDLIQCITSAWKGPERLGIGMPMTVLAVTGQISAPVAIPAAPAATPAAPTAAPAINAVLNFKISADRMTAQFTGFKPDIFTHPTFTFTRESLASELRLTGIIYGLTDDIWNDLEARWNARENLNERVASTGTDPLPGADPYVHLVYKDAPEIQESTKNVDIREAQQRTLVHKGQLVAEIRYKKPPVPGKSVTGHAVHAPLPPFDIKLGDGIAQQEAGKFYATEDGLPVYEDGTLTVNKTYVHKGDVDLKSGNIRFNGPVEIHGSIDTGAVVDVQGPINITGMIRGGFVRSGDSITVKQGIVTTERGRVSCSGNLKAEFIENSRIECGGILTVNKAILNSQVFAGKSIEVASGEGVVGGGLISCRDVLVSNNIGFPSGAKTTLIIGADVRALKRVTHRTARVEALKLTVERYKAEQRELQGKRDAQLTPKHKERKKSLATLINKIKTVIEHAEAAANIAKTSITYNPAALLAAYNRLSVNCSIEVSGQTITLQTEMLATAVTGKLRRDSHLCTIEDVKSEINRQLGRTDPEAEAPAPTPKKAG